MDQDFIGKRPGEPSPVDNREVVDLVIGRARLPTVEELETAMDQVAHALNAEFSVKFSVKFHIRYVGDSPPPNIVTLENNLRGYLNGLGFKLLGMTVRTGSHV